MKITNKHGLPEPMYRALANDSYQQVGDISVTTLIGPPQIRSLYLQHEDEIEEDAMDRVWSMFGSACHYIIEQAGVENALSEERLTVDVDGTILSGQFDLLTSDKILWDFKTTSAWSIVFEENGRDDWHKQLNIYAWMLNQHGFEVYEARVVAILRDWSQTQAKRSSEYPQQQVVTLDIPLWGAEKTQTYIEERIAVHRAAEGLSAEELAEKFPCSKDERWEKDTKYAVMKHGRKSAVKLCDSSDEASTLAFQKGSDHYVEVRAGEATRCLSYCPVAKQCMQNR